MASALSLAMLLPILTASVASASNCTCNLMQCTCTCDPVSVRCYAKDLAALRALHSAANVRRWSDVIANDNCCSWGGVCCTSSGRVSTIQLSGNKLNGSIPSELGSLSELTVLELTLNSLEGSLPSELGNLTKLQHM